MASKLRHRRLFRLVYFLYLLGLVWLGTKAFWWLELGVSPLQAPNKEAVWKSQYPEVWNSGALDELPEADSPERDQLDVLLLGGSVLHQAADQINEAAQASSTTARIYNVASTAHTSRDSYLKYQLVADRRFDVIAIYHGINDLRMNCCEDDVFRDDYTHCNWYNELERKLADDPLAIAHLLLDRMTPLTEPSRDQMKYGRTIKTRTAFRRNIESIVQHAAKNRTRVVLMSFAHYLAPGYSEDRYKSRSLDYGKGHHQLPVEVWGEPEHVMAGLKAHNEIIRELASQHEHVVFLDLDARMPKNGEHFSDICHLTQEGDDVLVKLLISAVCGAGDEKLVAQ